MKTILNRKNIKIALITFTILLLAHLPLMTKNIISADILLNNNFYKGYSWEISLGRFGLYIIGIIKSFITIPHIDLIISYIIISISTVILIDLFKIKEKGKILLLILLISLSQITSATLLFNYCSIGYTLSFLCSILSVYLYYKLENKYLKYILPIILIIISLSMYQAYLSVIITTFVIYNIKLLIENKISYKKTLKYLIVLIIGVLSYFVLMKISLILFHIDMSSYSNADKIGLKTIINIPNKVIDTYRLFYEYYFTDNIIKNIYMKNNIINLLLVILIPLQIFFLTIKNKTSKLNKILILILILTLPIYLNSIIFTINERKLQLLMSSSYILIPILLIITMEKNKIKYLSIILFIILFRTSLIQNQATYLTLENTFNKYNIVINSTITNNLNNLEKSFAIIGQTKNETEINKLNYGFISDEPLFWNEYNLKKLGFERFCYQYYGLNLNFASEEKYNEIIKKNKNKKEISYIENDTIIINFDNLH